MWIKRFIGLFLVLLLAGPAHGISRYKVFVYLNKVGGLDTKSSTLAIQEQNLGLAKNIDLTTLGARSKRRGSTKHNSTQIAGTPVITGLFEWERSNGLRQFFAATETGIIYKDNGGVWEAQLTGLTTGEEHLYSFANWRGDRVIACNGPDTARGSTDGSSWSVLTTTPSTCKLVTVHRRRLWIVANNSGVINHSVLNDETDFTGGGSGSFAVGSPEGGVITGIASFKGVLVIFKERSIHLLRGSSPTSTDPAPFILEPLVIGTGAAASRSIIAVMGPEGTDLFYASRDGVARLSATQTFGDFRPSLVSDIIEGTWNALNKSKLSQATAVFYSGKSQYWIAVPGSGNTHNTQVLKYDTLSRGWTVADVHAHTLALRRDPASEDLQVYSGNYTGTVFKQDAGTFSDAGVGYSGEFRTAWLDFGVPEKVKNYGPTFRVFIQPTGTFDLNVSYTIMTDKGIGTSKSISLTTAGSCVPLGTFILGTSKLCATDEIAIEQGQLAGEGRFIQLRFSNSAADEQFKVFGFTMQYRTTD